MLVKRLTLAAGVETAFEFDEYAAKSVVVKNETAGEILFCDGPFDATRAAHIPAFSWQAFDVKVHYDSKPAFYVKAVVAGNVEIDFGSQGVGGTSGASVTQLSGSKAQDSEAVAVDNTAGGVALAAAKYAGCRAAFITVEDAQLRWTIDGTSPTTTVGHIANPADIIDLVSAEDIAAFRAIRTGSASAKLYCTYSA